MSPNLRLCVATTLFGIAIAAGGATAIGCSLSSSSDRGPCADEACDSGRPVGPVHGQRADGTVDVTAAEAWPNRAQEGPPLTAIELARACEILGACITHEELSGTGAGGGGGAGGSGAGGSGAGGGGAGGGGAGGGGAGGSAGASGAGGSGAGGGGGAGVSGDDETVRYLVQLCLGPDGREERAIPEAGLAERRSFHLRAVLGAGGDCSVVRNLTTKAPDGLTCEEVGCWWRSDTLPIPDVTCRGDVATLVTGGRTFTRDCARAYARCDASSPTGCTDRRPTACDSAAKDRCDGDVKLGCDRTGRVSFHDCARQGGQCRQSGDGVACVYPSLAACSAPAGCAGSSAAVCAPGGAISVDCAGLGLACSGGRCAMPPASSGP